MSLPDANRTSRRGFLRTARNVVPVAAVGALGYAWGIEPHWYELSHRPMPLVDLPPQWHGKKLLQLSDLHVGATDDGYLDCALRHAADLAPDVVVITGDFVSFDRTEQIEEAARLVSELGRPPHGIYATFGNHDYGFGWSNTGIADALARRLDAVGVRALRNEGCELDGLRLVGLDDMWGPHFDLPDVRRALRTAADGANVVLCHNPDACDLPLWDGVRGWVLAGHTHGGQCRPPFLPAPIVPVGNKRYVQGVVPLDAGRTLHVSRGLGYTHRVRFNARPEMTLFTLQAA